MGRDNGCGRRGKDHAAVLKLLDRFGVGREKPFYSDVAMRMMESEGYVPGQGLGVHKQGIVDPLRPSNTRKGNDRRGLAEGVGSGEVLAAGSKRRRVSVEIAPPKGL